MVCLSNGAGVGDYHRRGVIHGHLHWDNILVQGDRARIIDAKGIRFQEDYPYTFRNSTGRTVTWDQDRTQELRYLAGRFSLISEKCLAEFMHGYGLAQLPAGTH